MINLVYGLTSMTNSEYHSSNLIEIWSSLKLFDPYILSMYLVVDKIFKGFP